ncbi:ABC transporter permease [Sphingobacterium corticis]|uniref:ABC transporter permease n=1 Tax=Sphingobacterium corticis TaxID=1812823 RepID=A0ABW5NN70_9SPHI
MIKNYIKIAVRSLRKNKSFSLLNILGLSIGMAAAIFISLWAQNELSLERFHEKGDRLYKMYNRDTHEGETWAWGTTPAILGPTLAQDYGEVEAFSRYSDGLDFLFTIGDKKLKAKGAGVDSLFLTMFSFPLVEGQATQSLNDPYNIVLTESFANTLFGDKNPIGEVVKIDSLHQFTVTGVLKNLPNNTLFEFEYLVPISYLRIIDFIDEKGWGNNSSVNYVLLKDGASQDAFDQKIKNITIDHTQTSATPSTTTVFTQPINRSYLYGKSENGKLVAGELVTVRLFIGIGVLILLIACINFMNLSTAKSEKRAKEVGVRKVVGVRKSGLIAQFLTESLLLSFLSFVLALLIVLLLLPAFNHLVQKELSLISQSLLFWFGLLLFVVFTGFVAGSYPAFYLSSFRPVEVLKGTFKSTLIALSLRKVLVVTQFTFAICLIISTIVIASQIKFGLDREVGYDREQLIYIPMEGDILKKYPTIRQELFQNQSASAITKNGAPISERWSDSWGFEWDGSLSGDEKTSFLRLATDADFVKTLGVKLVEGRDIDIYTFPTDSNAMLINQAAATAMRLDQPIGKRVWYKGSPETFRTIVGVVENFVTESPYRERINPMFIEGPKYMWESTIHIKLPAHKTTKTALNDIEQTFKKHNPEYPFNYTFVDEAFALKFARSERIYRLVVVFAGLTIFISCLGLFGLAAYTAQSRTKEIGVRKVLGASVFGITQLLSREFLVLVLIAFVVASPIAWWAMSRWLDDYSYKIAIEWWIFALTALLAVVITLATVSFQSIKAAIANPVNSLRDE